MARKCGRRVVVMLLSTRCVWCGRQVKQRRSHIDEGRLLDTTNPHDLQAPISTFTMPIPPNSAPSLSRKVTSEPLPNPTAIIPEHHRRRHQQNRHAAKDAHANPIPVLVEQPTNVQWNLARHKTAEHGACSEGGGGVLLESVDVVVLRGVEDGDLAGAEEERGSQRNGPGLRVRGQSEAEPEEAGLWKSGLG
jgi:hypothetical protein